MRRRAIIAFFFACAALSAQTFRPFTALRTIKTERFDIIFPERSRPSAERLASFADAAYERVSGLLGIRLEGRIPVVVTPDSDLFNGYANPVPHPHIVLYEAPLDPEWTTFPDALEGLFIHELTHVVSLSARGPAADAFYRLFGGWVLPTYATAPLFMVEGATVSFESLGGFGRANDPLVRQRLSQAVEDGSFLTPFQASGVYDKPPYGNAYYEYGGLFSAHLQERWGMERYARLWAALGSRFPFSFRFYRHGFYSIFKEVYGEDFLAVWKEFSETLRVEGLEDNRENLLLGGERSFETLRAGGGRLFFADKTARAVFALDPATGAAERVAAIDSTVGDIDVSSDGSLLLVDSYRAAGSLSEAVVVEHSVATGKRTGRQWAGISKPRYFRDGIVGIAADGFGGALVRRDAAGTEHILLRGDGRTIFSSPAPIDEDRIAFIVSEGGVRSLGVHDARTGETFRLGTGRPGDAERFRYVRDLRAQDGKLYFSYAEPGGFYKLGVADEAGFVISDRSFSGGVFAPVEIGGRLFYRGAFSAWDAVLRFPESAAELSGLRLPLLPERASFGSVPAPNGQRPQGATSDKVFPERPYSAASYLNPLRFWLPFPLVRTDGKTWRVDGGGVLSFLSEPTDTDFFLIQGGYDHAGKAAFASVDWTSYGLGFPLSLSLSDGIEFVSSTGFDDPYRATRASFAVGLTRGIGGERVRGSVSASASTLVYAFDPDDGSSAYSWPYAEPIYTIGVSAGLSSLSRPLWRLFGEGASAAASAFYRPDSGTFRAEGVFRAAAEPALPVRLSVYGAFDEAGMSADGSSLSFGAASFGGMEEYASSFPGDLRWIAGAEAEFKLFSLETQGSFSHLYFNRFFGVLSWRGAVLPDAAGSRFIQSAALKAGAVVSLLPLAAIPLRFSPHLLAVWKLSELGDADKGNDWYAGFAMTIEW